MKQLLTIGILITLAFTQWHCEEIRQYPNIPLLRYENFSYTDTVLTYYFADGDGNFGIIEGNLNPPFDSGSIYYHNVFLKMYEKVDTGYEEVELLAPLNWRLEHIPQPQGQNKTLRGDIDINLAITIQTLGALDIMPDTFRFDMYIVDRDLHRSNTASSPDLVRSLLR
jgi:hypothetical protein